MKIRFQIFSFASLLFFLLIASSCNKNSSPRENCMHCTGCFNSWDECKEDYHQDSIHPYTWEEYVNLKISENPFSTDQCERVD